ncbi:hypothetical protein EY643_12765 [Halioglobus maricola]|uniref:Uncharacterized protein n=1 Tax=Halioglobus maricola TaxID=2601894 RepID=A0A5P9NKU1_9GAMM|nr:hypothetical protein [Halioglobus maricola]QFU76460.1 hypothetical protein EY643_12765 [Halioglobus maricola]
MNNLLLAFALTHAMLLAWTFRAGNSGSLGLWWLRALLVGMCYDNLVQASGQWFVGEAWYEAANTVRFFLHAVLLPMLMLFALHTAQLAGVGVARTPAFISSCRLFTAAAIAWGLYHEVWLLQLEPVSVAGVDKLRSTSTLPPVATILTNLLVLPIAFAIWRIAQWRWLLLGTLFIFVVNGATGAQAWGFAVGNFAEIVYVLTLLGTEKQFSARCTKIRET